MISIMSGDTLQDGQKVLNPACGSGRMLLAAAKRNRFAKFYGADLDIACCKMALINMLLNSLQGEIAHLNSLSNEFYRGYKVRTTLIRPHYIPYYIEFTEPELSNILLSPVKEQAERKFDKPFELLRTKALTDGIQGTLF